MTLYTLTYKAKQTVKTGLIEASSLESAERIGRAYCNEGNGQRRFIGIADAIIARENEAQAYIAEVKPQFKATGMPVVGDANSKRVVLGDK